MKKEQAIEKIYDLIEQFDFEDLSEGEKSFVLKHISYAEFATMRSTIVDTNELFSKDPVSNQKENRLSLKKIAVYPIALYKIAATIILLIGIAYLLTKSMALVDKELLAQVDTIYIEKTDTIVLERTETVEVIKTKIVYRNLPEMKTQTSQSEISIEEGSYQRDCSREICPDDMTALSKIKTKGNFSEDLALTDFIVSLN